MAPTIVNTCTADKAGTFRFPTAEQLLTLYMGTEDFKQCFQGIDLSLRLSSSPTHDLDIYKPKLTNYGQEMLWNSCSPSQRALVRFD